MPELSIDRDQRLALRAQAHALKPVVLLGAAGLTPAVVREIDRALAAHELIKVRVPGDDRDEREGMLATLAARLDAAPVQAIGKLLVLWRPRPPEERREAKPPAARRPQPPRTPKKVAGAARAPVRSAGSAPKGRAGARKAPAGKSPAASRARRPQR